MTDPDNAALKDAYEKILAKYSTFPFNKQEYEPFVNDVLLGTPAVGEAKSDLDLLCDAWIKDMKDYEFDKDLEEGFNEDDWEKYIREEGREEMDKKAAALKEEEDN